MMGAGPPANKMLSVSESRRKVRLLMASPHDIESARLAMLDARKALEDYETLKGFGGSYDHARLSKEFNKATHTYL